MGTILLVPPNTPTRSASPCNSPTSSGTSARTRATDVRICPPKTSPSSAARPVSAPLRRRPAPTSPVWWSSKYGAPAPCSPPATSCCRCSTAAAVPASRPWPASTGGCWSGSPPTPRPCCAAGSPCPAARRPTSRYAAWPASTPGAPHAECGARREIQPRERGSWLTELSQSTEPFQPTEPSQLTERSRTRRTRNFADAHRVTFRDGPPRPPGRGPRGEDRMSATHTGGRHTGTGPDRRTAVVVGGGLAGTTAALALADAGVRVTLTEARPRLGGLAFSFRRGELTVDNGQHVFLRCCTAYQWFLDRIAARDLVTLQDRLDVPVLDADTMRLGRLSRAGLPVPLHLAASLARYPHLSLRERASVGRAALALRGLDLADPALDRTDFGSWLAARGQSPRTIEALWDLVGVATLNATAGESSLALAAMVFKTGLLSDPGAADIGWASAPLGDLHDVRARTALDAAGVRTLLRARAAGIKAAADGGWQVPVETG